MKKICAYVLGVIITLTYLLNSQIFCAQPKQYTQKPLHLMILLDEGGVDTSEAFNAAIGKPSPMVRQLGDGLDQKIPMIVSTPLLFDFIISCEKSLPKSPYLFLSLEKLDIGEQKIKLIQWKHALKFDPPRYSFEAYKEYREKSRMGWLDRKLLTLLEDPNKWRVYECATKDFVILLPVKYFCFRSCFESAKVLHEIRSRDIKNHFVSQDSTQQLSAVQEYAFKQFNIQNFAKLFNMAQPLCPKNIYLAGHGSSGESIAGISIEKYKELLRLFSKIDVQFLYVTSCFAGGVNLLKGHEDFIHGQSNSHSGENKFVIAVNGTEDTTTTHQPGISNCKNYLRLFFARLDLLQLALHDGQITSDPSNSHFRNKLYNVLSSLYLQSPGTENLSSVFVPGKGEHFQPVSSPNTFNVTCDLLTHGKLIEIDGDNIEAVLICPSMIRDIPLVVKGHKMPYFATQIRGQGQHFIETLIAPDVELSELLYKGFLPQNRKYASCTGWFFDICVCCNTDIKSLPKGIIVLYGLAIGRGKDQEKSCITFRVKNDVYFANVESNQETLWCIPHLNASSQAVSGYQQNIKQIIELTKPSQELLECASGGCELIKSLTDCAEVFAAFAGQVPFSPILTGFASKYVSSSDEALKAAAMGCALEVLEFRSLLKGELRDKFTQLTQGLIDEAMRAIMQDNEIYTIHGTVVRRYLGKALADSLVANKMFNELKSLVQKALREKKSVQLILGLALPLISRAHECVDSELCGKLFDLAQESIFAVKESKHDWWQKLRANYSAEVDCDCAAQFLVAAMKKKALVEIKLDEIMSNIVSKSPAGFLTIAEWLSEERKFPELIKFLTEPVGDEAAGWIKDAQYKRNDDQNRRTMYLLSSILCSAGQPYCEELGKRIGKEGSFNIQIVLSKCFKPAQLDENLKLLEEYVRKLLYN